MFNWSAGASKVINPMRMSHRGPQCLAVALARLTVTCKLKSGEAFRSNRAEGMDGGGTVSFGGTRAVNRMNFFEQRRVLLLNNPQVESAAQPPPNP